MSKPIAIVVTLDCGCSGGNNRADIPRLGITFFNDDPAEAAARAVRFAVLHAEQTADDDDERRKREWAHEVERFDRAEVAHAEYLESFRQPPG